MEELDARCLMEQFGWAVSKERGSQKCSGLEVLMIALNKLILTRQGQIRGLT